MNHMEAIAEDKTQKVPINSAVDAANPLVSICSCISFDSQYLTPQVSDVILSCSSKVLCSRLPVECLDCSLNYSCIYGEILHSECEVKAGVTCQVSRNKKIRIWCFICCCIEGRQKTQKGVYVSLLLSNRTVGAYLQATRKLQFCSKPKDDLQDKLHCGGQSFMFRWVLQDRAHLHHARKLNFL